MSACSLSSRVSKQPPAHPLTLSREQREKNILSAAAIVAHFYALSSISSLYIYWVDDSCHMPVIKVTREDKRKPGPSSALWVLRGQRFIFQCDVPVQVRTNTQPYREAYRALQPRPAKLLASVQICPLSAHLAPGRRRMNSISPPFLGILTRIPAVF
jgi:hypothetical protein